jgi:hydroxymethylbilane synthase
VSLPAIGQGALGIESRTDDRETRARLEVLADATTSRAVHAERGVLIALGADCKTPVGAFAERASGAAMRMRLRAFVLRDDGTVARRDETTPWPNTDEDAEAFGRQVGNALIS